MAEEEKTLKISVETEEIGPACKRLTIEIDETEIATRVEENYQKLRTDAVLPGFRKGRAPQRLIERRFGSSVREDVCAQLLSDAYAQAIEEQDLKVLGEPDVKDQDDIKLPDAGALTFTVEVEVAPDVTLPDLEGVEVTKVAATSTAADTDRQIEQLCQQYGRTTVVEGAAIEAQDMVSADVALFAGHDVDADAERIAYHPYSNIFVGGEDRQYKGHVAGIVVDDLGKRIIGKTSGDQVSIETTGPKGHENESIRDQPITIKITLGGVHRFEPIPVADLPAKFGFESAEELREQIEESINMRQEREQTAAMHEQICKYLEDNVDLELPAGMTGRQTERLLRRKEMEMSYMQVPAQEIEGKLAEARQSSEEEARRDLKRFFIIEKAASDLDIEVTEREINGRIAAMAVQQGRRPEKLRTEMHRSGQLEHLYLSMREQKTLDQILEKAKVTERDAAEPEADAAKADDTKVEDTKVEDTKAKADDASA